jgi:hypothetical protein
VVAGSCYRRARLLGTGLPSLSVLIPLGRSMLRGHFRLAFVGVFRGCLRLTVVDVLRGRLLSSRAPVPKDLASCGTRLAPKNNKSMARMTSSSTPPIGIKNIYYVLHRASIEQLVPVARGRTSD